MKAESSKNHALTVAAFIIIIAGCMYAASIIKPLLMALFVSIVCAYPIMWLQKKKVPQGLAILIVFIGILALFFGFGQVIGRSLSSFSEQAPLYEKNLAQMSEGLIEFLNSHGVDIEGDKLPNLFEPSKLMNLTAGFLGQLGSFMGNMFTIVFLVLFLLMEMDSFSVKAKAIVKGKSDSLEYLLSIGSNIRHYLSIKTLTSLLTGLAIWVSLAIIGVDYAIIWALVAFLLNYIPNIGSILAAVPAILFATVQLGAGGALLTTVVFVVVNVGVGSVLEPKLMGDGMGLSTFIVFFSLIFWGFVFGTVGMFLSVPLTIAIKIMLEQNPDTKLFAIVLGTPAEAEAILEEKEKK